MRSIVVANGPGGIKAKVRDETGRPRSRVAVLVVPEEEMKMQWHRYQSRVAIQGETFTSMTFRPAITEFLRWRSRPLRHYIEPWSCGAQKSRDGKT